MENELIKFDVNELRSNVDELFEAGIDAIPIDIEEMSIDSKEAEALSDGRYALHVTTTYIGQLKPEFLEEEDN